ncbi:Leucine-rich repeat containing protein [Entamoeba marina]
MSQLPKVYLANVTFYIGDLNNLFNFLMINTKCQDAVEILRINPLLQRKIELKYPRNVFSLQKSFIQLFTCFPNIETVHLDKNSLRFLGLIPHSIAQIWISHYVANESILPEIIQNKATSITISTFQTSLPLSQFKQLRRITIEVIGNNDTKLTSFFDSKTLSFDFVRIKMNNFVDCEFLENLKFYGLKHVVIEFNDKSFLERAISVPNVFQYAIICHNKWYHGIDNRVIVLKNNSVMYFNQCDVVDTHFMELYYPNCVEVIGNDGGSQRMDFSQFTFIDTLNQSKDNVMIIPPCTLTHLSINHSFTSMTKLKELDLFEVKNNKIELPTTLTHLLLFNCDIKITNLMSLSLKKLELTYKYCMDIRICTSLTHLFLYSINIPSPLTKLTSLQSLILDECKYIGTTKSFFPSSLQSLDIIISDITLPHKMSISKLYLMNKYNKRNTSISLTKYTNLTELKLGHLSTQHLTLPTSLKILYFKYGNLPVNELHLEHFTQLQQIGIHSFQDNSTIYLPTSLQTFILYSSNANFPNIHLVQLLQLAIIKSSTFDYNKIPSTIKEIYIENKSQNIEVDIYKRLGLYTSLLNK